MPTAWLFHDSLVRQALLSRQHSCYRVNLCHLIGLIITFHQRYWSVSPLLKGTGEKKKGAENVPGKREEGKDGGPERASGQIADTLFLPLALPHALPYPDSWIRHRDWLPREKKPSFSWYEPGAQPTTVTHWPHRSSSNHRHQVNWTGNLQQLISLARVQGKYRPWRECL